MSFKVGDRVVATKTFADITAGKIYKVAEVDAYDEDMPLRVTDDVGDRYWLRTDQFTPAFTIIPGKFYHTASGAVTGRVTKGDTGFEAVVDGKVRIFDAAGGAVHGGDDIVEEWVPRVGERARMTEEVDGFFTECPATIVHDDGSDYMNLHLEFDTRQQTCHGCDGYAKPGHGWFVTAQRIEPLPIAAPAQPAGLRIREGIAYKAANGAKVGPLIDCGGYWNCENRTGVEGNPGHYTGFGISAFKGTLPRAEWRSEFDLVAEWVDEPTAPVSAQVDAIADEYGPVPANDNAQSAITVSISLDTGNMHEELDELIAKLKKVRELQRQVGLAA